MGGGFSNVTTTAAGVVTFEDTGLTAGTTYQYRIRTTDGVNTSVYTTVRSSIAVAPSIVTTHACSTAGPFRKELSLPRFTDAPDEWRVLLNELVEKIERNWNEQVVREPECVICETNTGALDIDCSRCNHFQVTTNEDINSITVEHCEGGPVVLTVINPGPAPITVCGWPLGFKCVLNNAVLHDDVRCCTTVPPNTLKRIGFSCRADEICLPDDTKEEETVSSGGGGSGGCGSLRIECEVGEQGNGEFDDASDGAVTCAPLDCSVAAPRSNFRARCGMPPYTWAITSPLTGGTTPVTTVTNTISGGGADDKIRIEPGGTSTGTNVAFCRQFIEWTNGSGACTVCSGAFQAYRCDGTTFSNCLGEGCCCSNNDPNEASCSFADPDCRRAGTPRCDGGIPFCDEGDGCTERPNANPYTCDCRSQGDKDSGTCEPCMLNLTGENGDNLVLTVTDSAGDSVSVTISVSAKLT